MKPQCVLVHGWGMPLGIFEPLINRLGAQIDFVVLELPGDTQKTSLKGLGSYVDFVLAQVDKPAWWLGWSFGGMLALELAAKHPEKVLGLMLVTSTPKFVKTDDWSAGVPKAVLTAFHQQVSQNYTQTLQQFLALQTMNTDKQRELTRELKLLVGDFYSLEDLSEQLNLLEQLDLRTLLPTIKQKTLWLCGEKDTLTPAQASLEASKIMPNAKVFAIKKCGHLPFWTHPDVFDQQLLAWIMK